MLRSSKHKLAVVRSSLDGLADLFFLRLLSKWCECVFRVWSMDFVGNVLSTIIHWPIVHLAHHAKHGCGFDQRSVGILQEISGRSEINGPKGLKEARRCQPVRKLLFPFTRAPAKCGQNGPAMHIHWGIQVRQTPKVLRVRRSFGQAGEPAIWR